MRKVGGIRGFTLIELIVAIGIMSVMFGLGIVTYTNFFEGRGLGSDLSNLSVQINQARSYSTAVFYPPTCSGLTGFRVGTVAGGKTVTISAVCTSGQYERSVKVLDNSTFLESDSFVFSAGNGSVLEGPQIIEIVNDQGAAITGTVSVTRSGVINIP